MDFLSSGVKGLKMNCPNVLGGGDPSPISFLFFIDTAEIRFFAVRSLWFRVSGYCTKMPNSRAVLVAPIHVRWTSKLSQETQILSLNAFVATSVLHQENGACTRGEILSRLSLIYTSMATNVDQRKWRQTRIFALSFSFVSAACSPFSNLVGQIKESHAQRESISYYKRWACGALGFRDGAYGVYWQLAKGFSGAEVVHEYYQVEFKKRTRVEMVSELPGAEGSF